MKTLFNNGSIHTMNGTEVVHSLLVEDGRILAVNCDAPAGECQVVDLQGKTVLPGFHDSHEHFLCYATDIYYIPPICISFCCRYSSNSLSVIMA